MWVIEAYKDYPYKDKFFTLYFDVLAAGPILREQIQKGMSAEAIRATWKDGLIKFGKIREKYLLYEELFCGLAVMRSCSHAVLQSCSLAVMQFSTHHVPHTPNLTQT